MPWNWIGRPSLASPDRLAELREQICAKISVPIGVIWKIKPLMVQRALSSQAHQPSWKENSEVGRPLGLDALLGPAT